MSAGKDGAEMPVMVKLIIQTDCGYGFDGRVPIDKVSQILKFSADCITSLPMFLIASQQPGNKVDAARSAKKQGEE